MSFKNIFYGTAKGTNNYSVKITEIVEAISGYVFIIKFPNANTDASTLNINGYGSMELVKQSTVPLDANDINANQGMILYCDGTRLQVIGIAPSSLDEDEFSQVGVNSFLTNN